MKRSHIHNELESLFDRNLNDLHVSHLFFAAVSHAEYVGQAFPLGLGREKTCRD
ncbi:MAG: hypothetical protein WCI18_11405 [Pseudomonadota bacterium]